MPRPKKSDPGVRMVIYIPETLHAEVTLRVWSEAENRVPYGVWSKYVEDLIRADLARIKGAAVQSQPNGVHHGN